MENFLQGNVPLRHLLNAKPPFMSWWRSAFSEVNDWALSDVIFPNLDQRITEGLKNTLNKKPESSWTLDKFKWVHERAIICSQNEDVEEINKICLDKIQSNPYVYRSHDR